MNADILFLERGCPHCGVIVAKLNLEKVRSDDFRGLDGQEFHIFSSQSNAASKLMLEKFGLKGCSIPALVIHDGTVAMKIKDIVAHLESQGMLS